MNTDGDFVVTRTSVEQGPDDSIGIYAQRFQGMNVSIAGGGLGAFAWFSILLLFPLILIAAQDN